MTTAISNGHRQTLPTALPTTVTRTNDNVNYRHNFNGNYSSTSVNSVTKATRATAATTTAATKLTETATNGNGNHKINNYEIHQQLPATGRMVHEGVARGRRTTAGHPALLVYVRKVDKKKTSPSNKNKDNTLLVNIIITSISGSNSN